VHVERGDTFVGLLTLAGLDGIDAHEWTRATTTVFDPRRLQPGHGLTLRFASADRELLQIRYELDGRTLLVVERTRDELTARREKLPYIAEVRGVAGEITQGLWQDVTDAGAPPEVASQLADIFGWDIDFSRLQIGDSFRVLYENIWVVGARHGAPGKVIGADLVSGGETITAVLFEHEDGRGGYYRPDGKSLGRMFLRYPVEYNRISSSFTHRRFHPILHRYRPHLGVDFAAPRGTPVRAAANGRVSTAGWLRGLGRTVRVDHADGLRSTYGHLNRIASAVRNGRPVKRGQVVGYVGSTGLATGAHLHYAVEHNGKYVNPLSLRGMAADPVMSNQRRAFKQQRDEVTGKLARLAGTSTPIVVTMRRPSR